MKARPKNWVNCLIERPTRRVKLFTKGDTMKTFTCTALVAILSLGFFARSARADDRAKDELENRAQTVNSLADRRGGTKDALHDVSVETGVPIDRIQKMHDQHPDAGAAGVMIACVLADNTKGSPDRFLSQHADGKGWAAIAHENNVPLDRINGKLDNLEHELNGLPATGAPRGGYNR
jgi:hypothetical protein